MCHDKVENGICLGYYCPYIHDRDTYARMQVARGFCDKIVSDDKCEKGPQECYFTHDARAYAERQKINGACHQVVKGDKCHLG